LGLFPQLLVVALRTVAFSSVKVIGRTQPKKENFNSAMPFSINWRAVQPPRGDEQPSRLLKWLAIYGLGAWILA